MSVESVKAFLEKMKTDKTFSEKIGACKDAAARMALVKAEGFDFSADELKKALAELSPEELSGISGGRSTHCDVNRDRCNFDCGPGGDMFP